MSKIEQKILQSLAQNPPNKTDSENTVVNQKLAKQRKKDLNVYFRFLKGIPSFISGNHGTTMYDIYEDPNGTKNVSNVTTDDQNETIDEETVSASFALKLITYLGSEGLKVHKKWNKNEAPKWTLKTDDNKNRALDSNSGKKRISVYNVFLCQTNKVMEGAKTDKPLQKLSKLYPTVTFSFYGKDRCQIRANEHLFGYQDIEKHTGWQPIEFKKLHQKAWCTHYATLKWSGEFVNGETMSAPIFRQFPQVITNTLSDLIEQSLIVSRNKRKLEIYDDPACQQSLIPWDSLTKMVLTVNGFRQNLQDKINGYKLLRDFSDLLKSEDGFLKITYQDLWEGEEPYPGIPTNLTEEEAQKGKQFGLQQLIFIPIESLMLIEKIQKINENAEIQLEELKNNKPKMYEFFTKYYKTIQNFHVQVDYSFYCSRPLCYSVITVEKLFTGIPFALLITTTENTESLYSFVDFYNEVKELNKDLFNITLDFKSMLLFFMI